MTFSPQWLVSCFTEQWGCDGGNLDSTWEEFTTTGVTTENCFPYAAADLACPSKCKDGSPLKQYYSSNAYSVYNSNYAANVAAIQQEIITNGPVEVAFYVFSDL